MSCGNDRLNYPTATLTRRNSPYPLFFKEGLRTGLRRSDTDPPFVKGRVGLPREALAKWGRVPAASVAIILSYFLETTLRTPR
jgi:hypothetical protein